MTNTATQIDACQSFAARLRHAADVIERLGVAPFSYDNGDYVLSYPDFVRAMAGREVTREPGVGGDVNWSITIQGLRFHAYEKAARPVGSRVTLPRITTEETV